MKRFCDARVISRARRARRSFVRMRSSGLETSALFSPILADGEAVDKDGAPGLCELESRVSGSRPGAPDLVVSPAVFSPTLIDGEAADKGGAPGPCEAESR